jgi:hypothetical protein
MMFRGILTTKQNTIETEGGSFTDILQQMEWLKREHSVEGIQSIDIYENDKAIAALRII